MKKTIEIDDTLQERVDYCKDELKEQFADYFTDNPGMVDFDDFYQEDSVHEIADSNTPIYNHEINTLYYLYGNDLDDSYNNAGCYSEPPDNYKQVCIYFYLEEQIHEYMREMNDKFDEFIAEYEHIRSEQIKKVLIDEFLETL